MASLSEPPPLFRTKTRERFCWHRRLRQSRVHLGAPEPGTEVVEGRAQWEGDEGRVRNVLESVPYGTQARDQNGQKRGNQLWVGTRPRPGRLYLVGRNGHLNGMEHG